jgi:hypothetical protein
MQYVIPESAEKKSNPTSLGPKNGVHRKTSGTMQNRVGGGVGVVMQS